MSPIERCGQMKGIKVVVERHSDGYIAYPLGVQGIVVGEGDTADEALADVRSAIEFHVETFGKEVLEYETEVLEAFLTETEIAI
jgi:predicted RNase H-like HicB family nuclease